MSKSRHAFRHAGQRPAAWRAALRPLLLAASSAGFVLSCGGADGARGTSGDAAAAEFDGAKAMQVVHRLHEFGPRVPGTPAHVAAGDWIVAEMRRLADTVLVQEWTHVTTDGQRLPMRNIIARFSPQATQRVLYLAHWDSRPRADSDPDPANRDKPVPGANDGGSGVAILMGVAEALKARPINAGVDLLFTDGEDWGTFGPDTDVLIGAEYFAEHLPDSGYAPMFGVLWDMVGDADPQFEQESHSIRAAPEVVQRVWTTAQRLGHSAFSNREYGEITDDHLPLIRKGLRVIDVIDLRYPYHHTVADTPDKVSQSTLQMVGDVAMAVLRGLP